MQTAIANAFLNNTNQYNPDGSLRYDVTGNYAWTDPTTSQSYNIPTFTATQSLTPQSQAIKAQTQAAQMNLAGMANSQSAKVAGLLSTPFTPGSSAPAAGDPSSLTNVPQAATSYASGGPIQSQLGSAGPITQDYGSQFDLPSVQAALMGQLQPQLDVQKNKLQQQLADQGIRYGSDAYNNAMMPFGQQENQAWLGAITGATAQQAQAMATANQRAQFQNAAQQQGYEQQLGAGSFANQAQAQQYQQNAALAAFRNTGLAQQLAQAQSGFNAQQAARGQYMQEQYAQRNQPLNEITGLLSGSQVSQPNFVNTPGSQIPTTDIGGLINQNFQQQMGIYQQQNQNYNSLMGGILGLGAGALKMSDRREKENIDRIATVFAADSGSGERKRLPIYQYSYKDDPDSVRHIGPMAQDVEKITPEAVESHEGIKFIKPSQVMGSILKAA